MWYVHSEEVESKVDEGMPMFLKLNDDLQNLIDKTPLVKIEKVKPLVFAAVIKAIKPGSNLRNYLESLLDIRETAFIQVLKSHFKEKDSSPVFHKLSNCVQLPSESELDFCLRAMSLRHHVMSLSFEEGCPFDEELVRKRFFSYTFNWVQTQ